MNSINPDNAESSLDPNVIGTAPQAFPLSAPQLASVEKPCSSVPNTSSSYGADSCLAMYVNPTAPTGNGISQLTATSDIATAVTNAATFLSNVSASTGTTIVILVNSTNLVISNLPSVPFNLDIITTTF